jgi:hypothetical protein
MELGLMGERINSQVQLVAGDFIRLVVLLFFIRGGEMKTVSIYGNGMCTQE